MRKLLLLTTLMLLLIGCGSDQDQTGAQQATTIFGRLSEIVQFGSTEETIVHKIQTDTMYVTVKGQVLMKYPAYLNFEVTDAETGAVRNDVSVSMATCHAADLDLWQVDSCGDYAGEMFEYEFAAVPVADGYRVEGFSWDRPGEWTTLITITDADGVTSETLTIEPRIYPVRPPSTNTFELVSLGLPFLVIVLFFFLMKVFRVQIIPQYELS